MIPTMVHGTKSTPRPRVEYFLTKEEKQKKERDLPNGATAHKFEKRIQKIFKSYQTKVEYVNCLQHFRRNTEKIFKS